MWTSPVQSAVVLAAGVVAGCAVGVWGCSVMCVLCAAAALALALSLVFRTYLANSRPRLPFPFPLWERHLSVAAEVWIPHLSSCALRVVQLATWQDVPRSVTTLAFACLASFAAQYINTITAALFLWCSAYALPFLWDQRQAAHRALQSPSGSPHLTPPLCALSPHQPPVLSPEEVTAVLEDAADAVRMAALSEETYSHIPEAYPEAPLCSTVRPFGEGACPVTGLRYQEGCVEGLELPAEMLVLFAAAAMCCVKGSWQHWVIVVTLAEVRFMGLPGGVCVAAFRTCDVLSVERERLQSPAHLQLRFLCQDGASVAVQLPTAEGTALITVVDVLIRQGVIPPYSAAAPPPLAQLPPPQTSYRRYESAYSSVQGGRGNTPLTMFEGGVRYDGGGGGGGVVTPDAATFAQLAIASAKLDSVRRGAGRSALDAY